MKTILGKISSVEYGFIEDYCFLFGLKLSFSLSDGTGVGDGGKYCLNISKECKWGTLKREKAIEEKTDLLIQIMNDAKVSNVSQLKGKPVEVTLNGNSFYDFRILKEVL